MIKIDLTVDKKIENQKENEVLNINKNNFSWNIKDSSAISTPIKLDDRNHQCLNGRNNNNNNLILENSYQKKYQPIDVEAFLKTLFSVQNN